MARPKKQGLDYFPLDVDMEHDDKMAMLIGEFGYKGELIFIKLLAYLYKNYGYFIPWDEVEQLKFAKGVSYIGGTGVNLINEVVVRSVKWGLFDEAVFNETGAATSYRIQKTWFEATRQRKNRVIDSKIWILETQLIPLETELIPVVTSLSRKKVVETPLIPVVTPQSKVKDIKENITKEKTGSLNFNWQTEKQTFLNNLLFSENFCLARRLAPAAFAVLRDHFITNIELKQEWKDAKLLISHFTNWFDKCQRDGNIDQQGNLKGGTIHQNEGYKPGEIYLNAIERRNQAILDQIG